MHSKNFDKVKLYYKLGVWGLGRVKNAVKTKWITLKEYQEIVGKTYED